MDIIKFTDLDITYTRALSAVSNSDCGIYLAYFKAYTEKVTLSGVTVPAPYQEIQVELSTKLLNHYSKDNTSDKWYKKPIGILTLAIISGVTILFIKQKFFPSI